MTQRHLWQALARTPDDLLLRLAIADASEEEQSQPIEWCELVRLDALQRLGRLTRPQRRRLAGLRRTVCWHEYSTLGMLRQALLLWLRHGHGDSSVAAADLRGATRLLRQLLSPVLPGYAATRRMLARLEKDPQIGSVRGHSLAYRVHVRSDVLGGWTVGNRNGRHWPGVWADWVEAALYGLGRQGCRPRFGGLCLSLDPVIQ